MINTLLIIVFFSGITLLMLLGMKFIYELIKGKKGKYRKSLRLFLNFGIILFFCFGAFISIATVVSPPTDITESQEQSLNDLRQWILNEVFELGTIGLCVILLVGFFSYLYQRRIEKLNLIKPIIKLTIINCLIVTISLFLIYGYTYNGLAIEVGYHFN